ncbi:transposase [Dactylosporangium fulvum]|uniref:Transposase n=1 Tax=Dactylosporangium fulvum TaxID=53359 RepID=A0ABY5VLQ9_9ACTN|nr:transposase [Dactylosporangium fulvum]UWP78497.1 transposase [Dactylosporangium fulvum]
MTAHALNVGMSPVVDDEVPALTRDRLAHIDQHYLRLENYIAANAVLTGGGVPRDSVGRDDGSALGCR